MQAYHFKRKNFRLGEFLLRDLILISYKVVSWIMVGLWKLWILVLLRFLGFFQKPPGGAWTAARRHMWLHPVSGFSCNLPGDREGTARRGCHCCYFSLVLMSFQWCCGSGWCSYCIYMNCMTNYGLQFLNWWKLHELMNGIEGIGFMRNWGFHSRTKLKGKG